MSFGFENVEQELKDAEPGQTLEMPGGRQQILGVVSLDRLNKRGDSWHSVGAEPCLVMELSAKEAILYFPERNKGEYCWYRAVPRPDAGDLGSFLKPFAQEFGKNGQRLGSVSFNWDDNNWLIQDIGRYRYQGTAESFMPGTGEGRYITATDGRDTFVYLDPVTGSGASKLFIGTLFDPADDIKEVD